MEAVAPFIDQGVAFRYKTYDYRQRVLLPVSLEDQLMPGTLEFAIHTLVEKRLNISSKEAMVRCFLIITFLLLSLSGCGSPTEKSSMATLTVDAGTPLRPVPPLIFGHNLEWVWDGQGLFKKDGTGPMNGLAPLVRALHPGMIRYPGGSLANTFRFVHSLGPLGARQPVANFFSIKGHWTERVEYETEKPLLGFDDFMAFTRATEAAGAMVTVNCTWWPHNPEISGTAQEAAAWVAYANVAPGAAPVPIGIDRRGLDWRDSRYWANLRRHHGHPQPYGVTHWEIGNEVYDPGQGAGVSAVEYAATAREFAQLMKAVDPSIKIGALIACDHPGWNDAVITGARPGLIDFLSLHTYGPGVSTGSVALWRNGSVDLPLPVSRTADYIIIIEASGQPLRGVGPRMRVALDGQVLGETFVDASRASGQSANYRYARNLLAGQHTLTVSFLNDAHKPPEDRNLFIEAVYLHPKEGKPEKLRLRPLEEMMKLLSGHADLLDRCLARVGGALRARGANLPIEVTEFNALYGTQLAELKESRDLKSALFSARYLQKFLENPMIEAANFWCLKSGWFMVIQNGPQGWRYAPAGLMFQAMAPLSRGEVVLCTWRGQPQFKLKNYPYQAPRVTAVAVRNRDQLAINLLSWHPTEPTRVQLTLKGVEPAAAEGKLLSVTGPGEDANNEEGRPASVTLQENHIRLSQVTTLELPPVSLSTLILKIK